MGIFPEANTHSTTKRITRSFMDISRAWLLHSVVPKMLAALSFEVCATLPIRQPALYNLQSILVSGQRQIWLTPVLVPVCLPGAFCAVQKAFQLL